MHQLILLQQCRRILTDACIPFDERWTGASRYGTYFIFSDRESAAAAEKAMNGRVRVQRFSDKWAFEVN